MSFSHAAHVIGASGASSDTDLDRVSVRIVKGLNAGENVIVSSRKAHRMISSGRARFLGYIKTVKKL